MIRAPMTLGNMRELGVHHLIASCLEDACRRTAGQPERVTALGANRTRPDPKPTSAPGRIGPSHLVPLPAGACCNGLVLAWGCQPGVTMRRRTFIAGIAGSAAWPLAARAQEKVRRVGVLLPATADDAEFQARLGAFQQGLGKLGWEIGRNVRVDSRWATTNAVEIQRHAAELAALAPDVILVSSSPALAALQQATRTVPIVFVTVIDPVGSGFVDSLARPGGNTTGFSLFEYSLSGKWLELLKQIAPNVTRVAVLRDAGNPSGNAQFGAIQAVAQSLGVEVSPVNMRTCIPKRRGDAGARAKGA